MRNEGHERQEDQTGDNGHSGLDRHENGYTALVAGIVADALMTIVIKKVIEDHFRQPAPESLPAKAHGHAGNLFTASPVRLGRGWQPPVYSLR